MKYNQHLMSEYDKYQAHQEYTSQVQENWQKEMKDFEKSTQLALQEMQNMAEHKIMTKNTETQHVFY
jgi:serine/threonine protein phosphatase PrpC